MNELLNALTRADEICKKAYTHYDRGTAQLNAATNSCHTLTKYCKTGCIILGLTSLLTNKFWPIFVAIALYFVLKPVIKQKTIVPAEAVAEAENNKAQRIFENNVEDMKFLPVDYWYPMATGYMIKMVSTQRADTLKEALAMFDAQLHRWKVEEANAQMVEQQMIQSAHLKSIKNSSRVNAAANVANTIFNIANSL